MIDNSYGQAAIQEKLLKALVFFDKTCRENNIYYALHGGTLLGAERNHHFIPWDDDADVSMKRSEYKKFQKVAEALPDSFELDEQTMWVPRLIMRDDNDIVTVDILIWDYISSNKYVQKAKITLLRFYQGMMKKYVEYKRFGMISKVLSFITHIIGKIIPYQTKLRQFKYLCEHALTGDCRCIHRSNDNYHSIGHIYDSLFMNEYTDIEFEGYLFMINKRYHEFLERSYGTDYLALPPKEQRIPTHEKVRR